MAITAASNFFERQADFVKHLVIKVVDL